MSTQGTLYWNGNRAALHFDAAGIYTTLKQIDKPCFVVRADNQTGVVSEGIVSAADHGDPLLAVAEPVQVENLGSPVFRQTYGLRAAYMAGAMANGIASEEMVIALAQAKYLASFGAAGLLPERIEKALVRFRNEIPNATYCCNLIHSPAEDALERQAVDLYLRYGLRQIEASAYMGLTPHLVRYRLAGVELDRGQKIVARNRIIAKLSRPEVAERFLSPPPPEMVQLLLEQGLVTPQQASLASQVPMADDITVEGDSGGHTDRRPLGSLFPTIRELVERMRRKHRFALPVRVGAAGGIGTPSAACAAFAMGADYIVTGSINQATVEAGTSSAVKKLLCQSGIADCEMAPAADMFEMGVKLQVLKKGVMFPMRAQKLYDIYKTYDGLDSLPPAVLSQLEKDTLRRPVAGIWKDVEEYFGRRDPAQVERAQRDSKRKMALVFRWYLGMSSRWAKAGESDRTLDYQVWCGPAMGSFNDWVQGTDLQEPEARQVVHIAGEILRGTAFQIRIQRLRLQGVSLPANVSMYRPEPALVAACV
jgi:PfaD family protein